jgi:hypothetical protein
MAKKADTQRGRAGSKTEKRDVQRARVLQSVRAELEARRPAKAARVFLNGDAHNIFPKGAGLRPWLAKTIGKQQVGELVTSFARFPCFYCKKGLQPCERCEGSGHLPGAEICGACAGLSVTRCEFCDGSAWATITVVPAGLQPLVASERAKLAAERVDALLARPLPQPSQRDPVKSAKSCAGLLLEVNRQLGVFENVVVAVQALLRTQPESKRLLVQILGRSCRAGAAAEGRVRELISQLAACSKLQADTARPAKLRKLATAGAAYYEELAKSDAFAGTPFDHPFLRSAVRRAGRPRD